MPARAGARAACTPPRSCAVRAGRGDMVRVRGVRPAREHRVDLRAARQRVRLGLDDERAAALADDKAVAVQVERTAGVFRIVVAAGQRLGLRQAGHHDRAQDALAARPRAPRPPRRLSSSMAAVIIASPPAEQAVLSVRLGPWMPCAIAICAAAMLPMVMGTKRGPTRWPASNAACVCATVVTPSIAVPITMPTRSDSLSIARPLSASACSAAANANCMNGSMVRASDLGIKSVGSKSLSSAAICTGRAEASNRVIGPTPQRPSISARQYSSTPMPTGVTAPMPVMTKVFSFIVFPHCCLLFAACRKWHITWR